MVVRSLLEAALQRDDHQTFMKEFLYKYMANNGLVPDEIFMAEIHVSSAL